MVCHIHYGFKISYLQRKTGFKNGRTTLDPVKLVKDLFYFYIHIINHRPNLLDFQSFFDPTTLRTPR